MHKVTNEKGIFLLASSLQKLVQSWTDLTSDTSFEKQGYTGAASS